MATRCIDKQHGDPRVDAGEPPNIAFEWTAPRLRERMREQKKGTGTFLRKKVIAVGTAVAGGPPHRSVREELPHTAPPLGTTVKIQHLYQP